jgi:hypothetical protein
MFTGFHFEPLEVARSLWLLDPLTVVIFDLAILAATRLGPALKARLAGLDPGHGLRQLARPLSYTAAFGLIVLCLLALAGGGYNPFIYFRF